MFAVIFFPVIKPGAHRCCVNQWVLHCLPYLRGFEVSATFRPATRSCPNHSYTTTTTKTWGLFCVLIKSQWLNENGPANVRDGSCDKPGTAITLQSDHWCSLIKANHNTVYCKTLHLTSPKFWYWNNPSVYNRGLLDKEIQEESSE